MYAEEPYAPVPAAAVLSVDGRSGKAGAAEVVVRADEEAVAGAVEVVLLDERSAPAPAPARSQGFGGEGIDTVG